MQKKKYQKQRLKPNIHWVIYWNKIKSPYHKTASCHTIAFTYLYYSYEDYFILNWTKS